jgi:hypothetical protein
MLPSQFTEVPSIAANGALRDVVLRLLLSLLGLVVALKIAG